MPQGQCLKGSKHNAKICKKAFLYIVYIRIYMLFSNIINTILNNFFIPLAWLDVNYMESVRFCNIFKALTGFEVLDNLLKRNKSYSLMVKRPRIYPFMLTLKY